MTQGELLLAHLRRARQQIRKTPNDPVAYVEAARLLLDASEVLRLRHPDNPQHALRCLNRADHILTNAEGILLGKISAQLFTVEAMILFVGLLRSRLQQSPGHWMVAINGLKTLDETISEHIDDDPENMTLAAAYIRYLLGMGHYAETLGFPVAGDVVEARTYCSAAQMSLVDSSPSRQAAAMLAKLYLLRGYAEHKLGDMEQATSNAGAAGIVAASLKDQPLLVAMARVLAQQGPDAMDEALLQAHTNVPETVHRDE